MPMPTGVAKLNIFYSGSSGLVVDTDLCESGFNWILNDCNVNSEGSQGGNYVPPPQTIWYMMQINPSADQQTNGSSLRKRADTSFSTEDVIAVEDIPEVFSFSCYSGEISNYTDVLADVRDFCETYSGSRLTYGDSITQLTEFGSISVEYCNDTSCPEQWTVGGDCLVAYLCMLWWCGPGHGLTSSASAIEGCTTWSFTYTGNREETPLAKRQQQIGSGEAQCNNTGPSASYMDVLNSTEAFCSNSDFVSSFDFGSLGVVPSKTTTRYTFDWTTCMFGMLSVLWECGPAGDGLTWGGTHDNGTATWFIRIDKTAKGDDIVPDRTITARQSSGTAPFAPVFSVGGGTGTCASTGPPALWTDVMDDSIDYCAANDGQLLGQLGIRGNYAWGWFDFVYVGPIGAQVTQPFSRIACEFALQAILWECGTGDSSGTQTTVGGTYTYHPNEEVTWGIYVGRNNKRELQQTARQAIEGPSSPQLETAHLVTRGNSGYCNTNAAYVPWEPVAQAVENFCQSQNGQKLYIGGYNQEGPIEVLNTNGYTITLRVTYCPDAPKGIPTHMTIETSVCEGPYALSWPVWGCTSSDGYIYGGGYTDGCTIYSIDVEPPSNNEREALQSSHEGQTIGMRDIVVRQSNLTCDGGPLASSDELQSDARNFCRLQSGITLPPNQTQMSKYPLREGDCSEAFEEIIYDCQYNGSQSSGGSKVVEGCITYELLISPWSSNSSNTPRSEPLETPPLPNVTCSEGPVANSTALMDAADTFCNTWNGFMLPHNATLSEQLELSPISEYNTMCARANMSITTACTELFVYRPTCIAAFSNITSSCPHGYGRQSVTAEGGDILDGCGLFKLEVLLLPESC